MIYLFNVLFCNRVFSYFAKPNFIVYDEWFDNDFKKSKLDFKNKKIKTIANMHEFFYEQSNYKVGFCKIRQSFLKNYIKKIN